VGRVDGATQVYAVLGQPVRHSQSPLIQNAAFHAAGMNAVYVALEVPAPCLEQALRGLHGARLPGLNLTTPHKEAAFALTRDRTAEAEGARAVNTLRWEREGWRGHATDGIGFLAWIGEAGIEVTGRRVILIGAGGAARSILPKLLALRPDAVHVVSRSPERARALARAATERGLGPRITSASWGDRAAEGEGDRWDLMIRAIPAEPVSDEEERWWRLHAPGAAVLDLNYGARAAAARARAREGGLPYQDGGALLIHQGAAAFEFWTGQKPSVGAMKKALLGAV